MSVPSASESQAQRFTPVNPVGDEGAHEGPRGYSHALKDGDTFAVLGEHGDINGASAGHQGLYYGDTRHLSRLALRIGGLAPVLLHASTRRDNTAHITNLVTPPLVTAEGAIEAGAVHVRRLACVADDAFHESMTLTSYARDRVTVRVSYELDADFADMFEIRGIARAARGELGEPVHDGRAITYSYTGLDEASRRTLIRFRPTPSELHAHEAVHIVTLAPGEKVAFDLVADCRPQRATVALRPACLDVAAMLSEVRRESAASRCRVETSNELYNRWFERSSADLDMLATDLPQGRYPYAGLPWFNAVFGRDGIITALETLLFDPSIARGVLKTLAEYQADAFDEANAAEPGKIIHELHRGEMARLGEIPFACYYGTCDATPLFVMLASAYFEATADRGFIAELWPHIEAALAWLREHGDLDGDGFIEYRPSSEGLVHQGWKDSPDAIFHADGSAATGPIALCEVQAYAHAAQRYGASLAASLGHPEMAETLLADARTLAERFDAAFWLPRLGSYALALDGDKRPCAVQSSNAGHALQGEIARPDRAAQVAAKLLSPALFSGWGIRTLGTGEVCYSPTSYHNGSVWPHDNAMIADGLRRYGLNEQAATLFRTLGEAASSLERHRLPETICGFGRDSELGPTPYPSACAPQAWAAGAAFMLLTASLGLSVDAARSRVLLEHPALPDDLDELALQGLAVGDALIDLVVYRRNGKIATAVERGPSRVEIVLVP